MQILVAQAIITYVTAHFAFIKSKNTHRNIYSQPGLEKQFVYIKKSVALRI